MAEARPPAVAGGSAWNRAASWREDGMHDGDPGARWFALAVRPRHEKSAGAALRYKGLEDFTPLYRDRRRWSDRFKEVDFPLFPGYVFCRFHPLERFSVLSTPGVSAIVGVGHRPAPVSDAEIESLRAVIRSGLPARPWDYLENGALVDILDGPLQGLQGILLETRQHQRLVLSVSLLRRSVAVEVDRQWVAPVTAGHARHAAG